jgi:hypothetical protein
MKDRKIKQVLSEGLVPVRRGKIEGSEYGRNTMYLCMKMEK